MSVETSKPADLLPKCDCDPAAAHAKDCPLVKWQMTHGGGESGVMGAPVAAEIAREWLAKYLAAKCEVDVAETRKIVTQGWWAQEIELLSAFSAAHISEVERVTKEREQVLDILWRDIDDLRDPKLTVVQVAAKAANAIHWTNVAKEAAESKLSQLQLALRDAVNGYEPLREFVGKVADEFDSEEPFHPMYVSARDMSAHIMGVKIGVEQRLGGDPMAGPIKLTAILNGGQS